MLNQGVLAGKIASEGSLVGVVSKAEVYYVNTQAEQNEITLIDTATQQAYKVYVEDGKLTMALKE